MWSLQDPNAVYVGHHSRPGLPPCRQLCPYVQSLQSVVPTYIENVTVMIATIVAVAAFKNLAALTNAYGYVHTE